MQIKRGVLNLLGFNPSGDLGPLTAYHSRRAGTVWFAKAPPTTPPTDFQRRQRDRFRLAAQAWKALTNEQRTLWHTACRRAGLYVHGYNLWVWWQLVRSRAELSTIERLSGCTLI